MYKKLLVLAGTKLVAPLPASVLFRKILVHKHATFHTHKRCVAFEMKKWTYILLIATIALFSCENANEKKSIVANLLGVRWENSELDFIGFDSTLIFIPIKDMYPTTCSFEYSLKSDTLRIINKTVNAYNLIEFKDSISYVKILFSEKDSIQLELLNDGAKELFSSFKTLTFFNSNSIDRYSYYEETDTHCLEQIKKAQDQIKNDSLVLCIHPMWPFRQETEFIDLLKNHGIKYKDLGSLYVLPIDRNCYRETMDYYIQKKFGRSFIDSLMKEADTLMVYNSRSEFIEYLMLVMKDHIDLVLNPDMTTAWLPKLNYPLENLEKNGRLAMAKTCLQFTDHLWTLDSILTRRGKISNFHLNNFNPELDWNEKYKDSLFKLGVERIKEDSIWVPGKILTFKVRTDNNVRVHFERINE